MSDNRAVRVLSAEEYETKRLDTSVKRYYLSKQAASKLMGCSIRNISNLQNDGLITPIKLPGSHRVLYSLDRLQQLFDDAEQQANHAA